MTDWATAESWLERTKAANRSSPAGYAWHEFWEWLVHAAPKAAKRPPMPFVLSGSAESAARKFHQLREQLRWACDNGVLAGAIAWLDACPPNNWQTCDPMRWNKSYYPTFDDVTDDEGDDAN
jgi:hypothetical protein